MNATIAVGSVWLFAASLSLGQVVSQRGAVAELCRLLVTEGPAKVASVAGSNREISLQEAIRSTTFGSNPRASESVTSYRNMLPVPAEVLKITGSEVGFIRSRDQELGYEFKFPFLEGKSPPTLQAIREATSLREVVQVFASNEQNLEDRRDWFCRGNTNLITILEVGKFAPRPNKFALSASYAKEGRLVFVAVLLIYPYSKDYEMADKFLDLPINDCVLWVWETPTME